MDEEYAIVSKKEFEQLKNQLDRLKKNPLGDSQKGQDLQDSIDNLSRSLNSMMSIFKEAADDMKLEGRDQQVIGAKIEPLGGKLDTLIEQNQKIAKGLIAVADMVKEKLEKIEEHTTSNSKPEVNDDLKLPSMNRPTMPPPPMSAPSGSPMPPPPSGMSMPPPPNMKKPIMGGMMK